MLAMSARRADDAVEWALKQEEEDRSRRWRRVTAFSERNGQCLFLSTAVCFLMTCIISLSVALIALYRVDTLVSDQSIFNSVQMLRQAVETSARLAALVHDTSNATVAKMQHFHDTVENASRAIDSIVEWESKPITVNVG